MSGRAGYESAYLVGKRMHSVKSETKCITTISTVNSRLADTQAIVEQQLNSSPTSDSCLLTGTLTRGHDGNCTMLRQFVDKAWSFFEK